MSFGDMQEHGECERCGDSSPTNSPTQLGFGLPAFLCYGCARKFILHAETTKEIQAWEKARAIRATFKMLMKDLKAAGATTTESLATLTENYRDSIIGYERAMAEVNRMAARFLANKEG